MVLNNELCCKYIIKTLKRNILFFLFIYHKTSHGRERGLGKGKGSVKIRVNLNFFFYKMVNYHDFNDPYQIIQVVNTFDQV